MKASIVDLRYKMRDVLKALKRREVVHVEYRRKKIARIVPEGYADTTDMMNHEFFGSAPASSDTVNDLVRKMRRRRDLDL